jgi:hypothetical protein
MKKQLETQKERFTDWAFPRGSAHAEHHRKHLEFIPIGSYGDLFDHSFLTNAACCWNNDKRLNTELAIICEPYGIKPGAVEAVEALGFTVTPLGDCHFWNTGTTPVALNFSGVITKDTVGFLISLYPNLKVTDLKYLAAYNVKGAV